jgi:hypothetical protein
METPTAVGSGMTLVTDTEIVGMGPLTLVHAVGGMMFGPGLPRMPRNQRYVQYNTLRYEDVQLTTAYRRPSLHKLRLKPRKRLSDFENCKHGRRR